MVGSYNIDYQLWGAFTNSMSHVWSSTNKEADDPEFVVGNGDNAANPSNAFEVSYDGHTTVYDLNNNTSSGTKRSPFYGATYADNTIVAWGDIPAGGGTPNADFGVSSVTNPGTGIYVVTLAITDPTTGGSRTLTNAAITVTAQNNTDYKEYDDPGCAYATVSQIGMGGGSNTFVVRTYLGGYSSCHATNLPFFFKVVGR